MSTLTKVFAVLLVIFTIAFTVMTVSFVAQTTNWRDTALKYQEHAQIADTNLRNMIAASSAELAAAGETIRAHLATIGNLELKVQESGKQVSQVQAELARVASEKSSAEAVNRGLLAQLETAEQARAEYRSQRDELERRNIDLERRNVDLNDRVNEQTARIAVMLEQKRQFEQQINILRDENQKLADASRRMSSGATLEPPSSVAMEAVTAVSPVAVSPIRGKIIDVSGNIVTISVGGADGVQKGMVFVVHRGDRYVGDLRVDMVDPNQSAGRPIGSAFTPQAGDEVVDAVRLGSTRG